MDSASAFGAEGCGFESHHRLHFALFLSVFLFPSAKSPPAERFLYFSLYTISGFFTYTLLSGLLVADLSIAKWKEPFLQRFQSSRQVIWISISPGCITFRVLLEHVPLVALRKGAAGSAAAVNPAALCTHRTSTSTKRFSPAINICIRFQTHLAPG
jgi:hypothetical protein